MHACWVPRQPLLYALSLGRCMHVSQHQYTSFRKLCFEDAKFVPSPFSPHPLTHFSKRAFVKTYSAISTPSTLHQLSSARRLLSSFYSPLASRRSPLASRRSPLVARRTSLIAHRTSHRSFVLLSPFTVAPLSHQLTTPLRRSSLSMHNHRFNIFSSILPLHVHCPGNPHGRPQFAAVGEHVGKKREVRASFPVT